MTTYYTEELSFSGQWRPVTYQALSPADRVGKRKRRFDPVQVKPEHEGRPLNELQAMYSPDVGADD